MAGFVEPMDFTNDPLRRSWVASANQAGSDFPLQNLPYAVFRRLGTTAPFRCGVAIGDQVVDLAAVASLGLFEGGAGIAAAAAATSTLNPLMQLGLARWTDLRRALFNALAEGSAFRVPLGRCLLPAAEAEFSLPASIGDFTDFYSSIHHATTVGALFRPDSPLLPNYKWVPIGYHGRSSSIGVSGQRFQRPHGQRKTPHATQPVLGATERLDYELELGVLLGSGNPLGRPIPMDEAETHVFGLCLLNDWSARDLQAWEYQPLGPFLAKNFATTVSPWVVSLQALAPYRMPFTRPDGDPAPLSYLSSAMNSAAGGIDIQLEALLETVVMRARGEPPHRLSSTSFRHSYWSVAQLVAHHTINGCNLQAGDLLGTGTQSGPTPGEAGSLLELSRGGTVSIPVGATQQRTFLEDGDTVIFRGWCEKPGFARVGFGEVRGGVEPAVPVD